MNAVEQSGGPSYLSNKRLIKREGESKRGRGRERERRREEEGKKKKTIFKC